MSPPLRRLAVAVALAAAAAAVSISGFVTCPIARFAHVPCPGCGLTRAALLLAHGRWADAARMHPLAPVLVPLLAIVAAIAGGHWIRTGQLPRLSTAQIRWGLAAAAIIDASAVVIWLVRSTGALGGPVPIH